MNIQFPVNITEILTKELVGKTYRYCIYNQPIMQPYKILKKKEGATLAQFKNDPKRFGFFIKREKKIGNHYKFEESKIVRISVYNANKFDIDEFGTSIIAELENDRQLTLDIQ